MITEAQARIYRAKIEKAAVSLSDEDALQAVKLFAKWDGNGHSYEVGDRFRYEDILYKVKQAHTSQTDYTPDVATSLYEQVAEEGQGTKDNPIPYNNNMELVEGLYYTQYEVEYYCFRSSGIAVYNDLSALVGIYVNIVTGELDG